MKARSAVVGGLEGAGGIHKVAAGEDVGILAVVITTATITLVFDWRHCYRVSSFVIGEMGWDWRLDDGICLGGRRREEWQEA